MCAQSVDVGVACDLQPELEHCQQHGTPPYSCAPIASSSALGLATTAQSMRDEWTTLLRLIQMALQSPYAENLRRAILFFNSKPIRWLYEFFERDERSVTSESGQRWLRGLLMKRPDNRIVEDIHCRIRNAARANANTRLTALHIQELIMSSNVLESRQVDHPTSVTKETFRAQLRSTRVGQITWRHMAARHKLPHAWTAIMGSKTWHSPTPESGLQSFVAWHRLQMWMATLDANQLHPPCPLSSAWFSTSARPHTFVSTDAGGGKLFACLGNAKWGVLGLPVSRVIVPDVNTGEPVTFLNWDCNAAVEWFSVSDPEEWYVLPTATISPLTLHIMTHPELGHLGNVCRVTELPVGLLKFFLRSKTSLVHANLLKLALHLRIAFSSNLSRQSLIEAISKCLANGDSEEAAATYIRAALSLDRGKTNAFQIVIEDPLCEEAYEELTDDDQIELQDLKKQSFAIKRCTTAWPRGGKLSSQQRPSQRPRPQPRQRAKALRRGNATSRLLPGWRRRRCADAGRLRSRWLPAQTQSSLPC